MIDLDAIRERIDGDGDSIRDRIQVRTDRRALLAYVDALRAAAGKVTCRTCGGDGSIIALHYIDTTGEYRTRKPCSDCTDLRAILGEQP